MDKPEGIDPAFRKWAESGLTLGEYIYRAVSDAQSQAYIDAARIADEYDGAGMDHGPDYQLGDARKTAHEISAAILSRKDEVGRN